MKRTIIIMLLVALVATPCFAQEVETDGLFSIEGTRWRMCYTNVRKSQTEPPSINHYCPSNSTMAFSQGTIYECYEDGLCYSRSGYTYIDLLLVSVVIMSEPPGIPRGYELYMLSPTIGLGFLTWFKITPANPLKHHPTLYDYAIGTMFKVDHTLTPPEVE